MLINVLCLVKSVSEPVLLNSIVEAVKRVTRDEELCEAAALRPVLSLKATRQHSTPRAPASLRKNDFFSVLT